MKGCIKKAEDIVASMGDKAYMLQQFNNPDNIKVSLMMMSPGATSPGNLGVDETRHPTFESRTPITLSWC